MLPKTQPLRRSESLFFFGAVILVTFFALLQRARSDGAKKILHKEEEIREQMLHMTKELGVSCVTCHDVEDFKKADKPPFQIAREHMRIVEILKANGFDGKHAIEASCKMCHNGSLKPNSSSSTSTHIKGHPASEKLPTPH